MAELAQRRPDPTAAAAAAEEEEEQEQEQEQPVVTLTLGGRKSSAPVASTAAAKNVGGGWRGASLVPGGVEKGGRGEENNQYDDVGVGLSEEIVNGAAPPSNSNLFSSDSLQGTIGASNVGTFTRLPGGNLMKQADDEVTELDVESQRRHPSLNVPAGGVGLIEEIVNGAPISNLLSSDALKALLKQTDHEVVELDLESFLGGPKPHEAFCPSCNCCIKRVIFRKKKQPRRESFDLFRCCSCFNFLIHAGKRFFCMPSDPESPTPSPPSPSVVPPSSEVQSTKTPLIVESEPPGMTPAGSQGPKQWDILKSIVYGGLIESITSLGIVTSAVGASAGTVNILALGLANLISGLFLLGHNLRALKKDGFKRVSDQTNEQVDQYQELLGQRENFIRHAIFAILSYLIFGTVPVVAYAFSFRGSNERELKLAVAMAASLFCIIMLAIGKAHIQTERKRSTYIKTVLYYGCSGVVTSGISYVAGSLIQKLVEKLGWFKESETVTLFVPEATLLKSA